MWNPASCETSHSHVSHGRPFPDLWARGEKRQCSILLRMPDAEKSVERGNVLASACPSRQILQHLTSRWGALVLVSLHSGTKRFSELHRAIDGVSERMLTKTLQELEADGMLIRKSYNTVPPQVDYTLTEFGAQASKKMFELVDWLEMNLGNILASQQNTVSQ